MNPSLDTDIFDVKEFVGNLLKNIPKDVTTLSTKEIHVTTPLYGGMFKFHVHLSEGSPEQLWEEVTVKLCHSYTALEAKFKVLLDLVKKKDEEIAEYKADGAKLIRSN